MANGTTTLTGRAAAVLKALTDDGYASNSNIESPTSTNVKTTTLTYGPGREADAQEVAASLGLPSSALKQGTASGIHLLIGTDWPTGNTYPGGKASAAPVNTKVALNNAHAQSGDVTNSCVHVSTALTIPISPKYGITPAQSYARHPEVPDSAP